MLKDFSVGSPMVFGSLLTALLLISGCSTNNSYYGNINTNPSSTTNASLIGVVAQIVNQSTNRVPRSERDQHEQCVYFALDSLSLGERCDWYSRNGETHGEVSVMSHRPQGSGHCTTLYNAVFHNGKWAYWQDVACKAAYTNQWRFVSR